MRILIIGIIFLSLSCSDRIYDTGEIKDCSFDLRDYIFGDLNKDFDKDFDDLEVNNESLADVIHNKDDILLIDEDINDIVDNTIISGNDVEFIRCPSEDCEDIGVIQCTETDTSSVSGCSDDSGLIDINSISPKRIWEVCFDESDYGIPNKRSEFVISPDNYLYMITTYLNYYFKSGFEDEQCCNYIIEIVSPEGRGNIFYYEGIASTPVCDSCGYCYVNEGNGDIAVFKEGSLIHKFTMGYSLNFFWKSYTVPISIDYKDEVILGMNCNVSDCYDRGIKRYLMKLTRDKVLWQRIEYGDNGRWINSPIITPREVFYLFDTDNYGRWLSAFMMDGEHLWKKEVFKGELSFSFDSEIIGDEDSLYLVANNKLYSISLDGEMKWSVRIIFSPSESLEDSAYIVIGDDNNIYVTMNILYYEDFPIKKSKKYTKISVISTTGEILKTYKIKDFYSSYPIALTGGYLLIGGRRDANNNDYIGEILIMDKNGNTAEYILGVVEFGPSIKMTGCGDLYIKTSQINPQLHSPDRCIYKYKFGNFSVAKSPWPMHMADPQNTGRVQVYK